jgi:P-type E1-E2 ATPase
LNKARGVVGGEEKKNKIAALYEKIEQNIDLVGATAIEDELQDEVKETIKSMKLSGMTFYILTGDKRETAISIGRSCGLID